MNGRERVIVREFPTERFFFFYLSILKALKFYFSVVSLYVDCKFFLRNFFSDLYTKKESFYILSKKNKISMDVLHRRVYTKFMKLPIT